MRKTRSTSTSSAAASHARTSRSQVEQQVSLERGLVFGASSLAYLGSYDPATQSLRTSLPSKQEDSIPFLRTLPRAGMMRSGSVYQQAPLALPTRGTESGSLPTPVAHDDGKSPEAHMAMKARMPGGARKTITSLSVLARNGFRQADGTPWSLSSSRASASRSKNWPTPQARDYKDGRNPKPHGKHSPSLPVAVATHERETFPTPTARDGTGGPGTAKSAQGSPNLRTVVGGTLNPAWLEWLMGFPTGWTELSPSATLSYRKSRRSASKGSKKSTKKESDA